MNKKVILILDNIRSVANTASIFRTADGLGVGEIMLVGTTPAPIDRFGRKRKDFTKVSLGAEEMVVWEYEEDISKALEKVLAQGYKILVLEQHPDAQNVSTWHVDTGKFALVVGNEVDGVSEEALKLADKILEIPMRGGKESLNVSVATGIALYELLK